GALGGAPRGKRNPGSTKRNEEIKRDPPVLLAEKRHALFLGFEQGAAGAAYPLSKEVDRPVGVPDQGRPERLVEPERVGQDRVGMGEQKHAPATRSAAGFLPEHPRSSENEKGGDRKSRYPLETHRLGPFRQGFRAQPNPIVTLRSRGNRRVGRGTSIRRRSIARGGPRVPRRTSISI